ncbi:TonB-dependent siderophore receptor [Croceicoccus sp. YJ47]|uniref:TonB-dependent siderophore receptor n=1 Tax=Croceicoccus sp. YJ47 TaxID=2798724 RepID=UPI001921BCBC|nr:TonB-dependent siderophore receptor [Croceicoccus sp. YJ47]QQN74922.1 TonB-dependent siderophore receptor [Croceicoccus sp. YJ47]
MTNWKFAALAALATGTAALAYPITASAQDAEATSSGEIVVTGIRQQYRGDVPLAEVPQTIQTIDGDLLENLNITRLDNALDLASGISRQNNFGGLWDAFAIRGFSGDENFPSGFLVNGFNGGRGYGGPRDASNIERVEILKGPNGAVFGRGEPGGTVNIITKKAELSDNFGSFNVSAYSFDTYRVAGDYNLVVSDTLALRVNGAAQDAGSFRDNLESKKIVASPSFLFAPTSTTKISYEMEYVDNQVPFDRGVLAVDGVLGRIPESRFLGEPRDGPIQVDVLGHQVQFQQQLSRDWFLLVGAGYRDTGFEGFSSDPELSGRRQSLDETGNILVRQRRYRDYDTTNTVFRGEISGKFYTGPLTHHVLFGADWDRFKINLLQQRYRWNGNYQPGDPIIPEMYAIDIFNPQYGQVVIPNATITDSLEKQTSYGLYFQDQIDITERLKLRIGGRYDRFKQDINSFGENLPVVVEKQFSPTAGVLYEVTDSLAVYAAYGTGFRPNSGLDAQNDPFPSETSESYEAGLRFNSYDETIMATLAAFTMTKDNILTNDPLNGNFSIAAGSARSRGIEADITANLAEGLLLIANYAYTDAEWRTSSLDKDFALQIDRGDQLINVPKHQANLLLTKDFDLAGGTFTLGGGVNYVGERVGETGFDFYLPDYTLVRALAAFQPTESIRLSIDATNLLDEDYYAASYHRYWVTPGQPRAITGRIDFAF